MHLILEQKWNILAAVFLVVGVGTFVFYNQDNLKDRSVDKTDLSQRMQQLVEDKKYQEAITLSDDAMRNYPNSIDIWIPRAMAFYFLGNCVEASAAAYHVSMIAPEDDENAREFLPSILNSELCASELPPTN